MNLQELKEIEIDLNKQLTMLNEKKEENLKEQNSLYFNVKEGQKIKILNNKNNEQLAIVRLSSEYREFLCVKLLKKNGEEGLNNTWIYREKDILERFQVIKEDLKEG